jgi:hypothetical protein
MSRHVLIYGLLGGGISVYLDDISEAEFVKPQLEAISIGIAEKPESEEA